MFVFELEPAFVSEADVSFKNPSVSSARGDVTSAPRVTLPSWIAWSSGGGNAEVEFFVADMGVRFGSELRVLGVETAGPVDLPALGESTFVGTLSASFDFDFWARLSGTTSEAVFFNLERGAVALVECAAVLRSAFAVASLSWILLLDAVVGLAMRSRNPTDGALSAGVFKVGLPALLCGAGPDACPPMDARVALVRDALVLGGPMRLARGFFSDCRGLVAAGPPLG